MTTPSKIASALEIALIQHSLRDEKLEKENESLRAELEALKMEKARRMPPAEILIQLGTVISNLSAASGAIEEGDRDRTETLLYNALEDATELYTNLRIENPRVLHPAE